ncbi:MAG: EI24 domain-containing protein [Planctomycetota bacterium]|jgi:CysZ protein
MPDPLPQRLKRFATPLGQFIDGFLYFFRGLAFLARHSILWPYAILPFVINLFIVLAAGLALVYLIPFLSAKITTPEPWWEWILFVFLILVGGVLGLFFLYFLFFMVLPGIIAPPFKGKLTKHTRQLIKKCTVRPAGGFWIDVVMPTVIEIRKALRFLGISLLLLPINLIPVLGQIAYLVLMSYFTWMHFALNYLEYPIDSESFVTPLDRKRRYVRSRRWTTLGFGCAISLLYLIPFVNFFCVPVGVVGATLLYQAYGELQGVE